MSKDKSENIIEKCNKFFRKKNENVSVNIPVTLSNSIVKSEIISNNDILTSSFLNSPNTENKAISYFENKSIDEKNESEYDLEHCGF